ncbi:hypothetical protein EXIGLDRAFT_718880, partial [Exidia glandulosa HHB12029]
EGYNVDILNPVRRQPSLPYPATASTSPGPQKPPHRSRFAFLHTTAGRIALALLAIVIIGAIVGGAVGGSLSHKKSASPASLEGGDDSTKSSAATSTPTATDAQPVGTNTGQPVQSGNPAITFDPNTPPSSSDPTVTDPDTDPSAEPP